MKSTALLFACLLTVGGALAQPAALSMPSAAAIQGGSAPIEAALTAIVPAPYALKLDDTISKSTQLTWPGGRDWMTALQQAAKGANLRVIPQWDSNTIIVASNAAPAAPPQRAPEPATAPLSTATVSVAMPSAAKSADSQPANRTWMVETRDVKLANTFQRWAAAAGWRVRWDAAMNVMVEAPDSFSGSFEEAITSQLATPGIKNSAYPLEVCFFPNTPPLARITRQGDQDKDCQ
jgi:hypothetical protein